MRILVLRTCKSNSRLKQPDHGMLGGSWVLITPVISLLITCLGDFGGLFVQLILVFCALNQP